MIKVKDIVYLFDVDVEINYKGIYMGYYSKMDDLCWVCDCKVEQVVVGDMNIEIKCDDVDLEEE